MVNQEKITDCDSQYLKGGLKMQIINDYSISNVFEVTFSAQSHKKSGENKASTFDTVSISDEAKQAYNKYILGDSPNFDLNNDIINKLNSWFNGWHTGSNLPINQLNKSGETSGNISSENLELKNHIEKEIDKILSEHSYDQFSVAPQEMIDRMRPLQQKLNAIYALGGSINLDEYTLNNAANYLQNLEEKWEKYSGKSYSLVEQFRVIKNNSLQNSNISQEEINERMRKIQEESLYNNS